MLLNRLFIYCHRVSVLIAEVETFCIPGGDDRYLSNISVLYLPAFDKCRNGKVRDIGTGEGINTERFFYEKVTGLFKKLPLCIVYVQALGMFQVLQDTRNIGAIASLEGCCQAFHEFPIRSDRRSRRQTPLRFTILRSDIRYRDAPRCVLARGCFSHRIIDELLGLILKVQGHRLEGILYCLAYLFSAFGVDFKQ